MKNWLISLLIIIFLSGCGNRVRDIEECIPKASFVSTKNFQFVSYKPKDKFTGGAYDSLRIGNSEDWYLNVVDVVNPITQIYTENPYEYHEHLKGSNLYLTGKAKIHEAWGLMTAFRSDIVYLNGTIDNRVVWVPAFLVARLKKSQNSENKLNMRISGLDKYKHGFLCN